MAKYFTLEGLARFREKLESKEGKLSQLESGMAAACEDGNTWHDNAAYDYLTNQIRMADRRLSDEHSLLNGVQIIEYKDQCEEIFLGSRVTILFDNEREEYEIVAFGEEDFDEGRILYESPLASTLLNHRVSDTFEVSIGGKVRLIKILDIKTPRKYDK